MPSTYTLNNGIELIATGEQSGTWGDTTNTNFQLLDTSLDGQVTVTLSSTGSSGSPNTLPVSDGAASNGRNRLVIFADSSDLGATAYVQLTPNDAEKIIYVRNNLSGSRSILLFQGTYNASNDYEVPAGTTAVVFFNGAGSGAVAANVFNNAHFDALNVVGNATFGGTVTATGTSVFASLDISGDIDVDGTTNLDVVDIDGAVDMASTLTVGGNISLTGATTISNTSGDLTLDVVGDIILDADGKQIIFADGGTQFGQISTNSTPADMAIKSLISDEDIIFQGIDNGSGITALTLDMSEAGAATFNSSVIIPQKLIHSGDTDTYLEFTTNQIDLIVGNAATFKSSASEVIINEASADIDFRVESDNASHMLFVDAGDDVVNVNTSSARFNTSTKLQVAGRLRVGSGIGSESSGMTTPTQPTMILTKESNTPSSGEDRIYALAAQNSGYAVSGNTPPMSILLGGWQNGSSRSGGIEFDPSDQGLYVLAGGSQTGYSSTNRIAKFTPSSIVFNEDSEDVDFRVESNAHAAALFVDGGTDGVGINSSAPISFANGQTVLFVEDTTNPSIAISDTGQDKDYYIYANGSQLGIAYADGSNTGGVTNATEIMNMSNGADGVIFNEGSADRDFRVESDSHTHAIYMNAANGTTSFGSSTPQTAYNFIGAGGIYIGNGNQPSGDFMSIDAEGGAGATKMTFYRYDSSAAQYQNRLSIAGETAETVFNDSSLAVDFRVESDGNTHMLFIDAGGEYVNINSSVNYLGGKLNVSGNKGTGSGIPTSQLVVADFTDMRAGGGGAIQFNGIYDTSGNITAAASMEAYKRNATSGNYGFGLQFKSRTHGGTNDERLYMDEANTTFNDRGDNVDFRVESDAEANMFHIDAGLNTVGIGTAPVSGVLLDVKNRATNIHAVRAVTQSASGATGVAPLLVDNESGSGTTTRYLVSFRLANTEVGKITSDSNTTSYQTTSDYRLKQNVVNLSNATDRLNQLQPKRFSFISDDTDKMYDGFLAHEVQTVVPEAVSGEHNETDSEGNPVYQGIDTAKLVPLLVATIKELEARITALENA